MARNTSTVLLLSHVDKYDAPLVGTKASHLGEMAKLGFPIPNGFILTAYAYFQFIEQNNLKEKIRPLLAITSFDRPDALGQTADHIKRLIARAQLSPQVIKEIDTAYNKLGGLFTHATVALRPSPTAKEHTTVPFAGKPQSILPVQGEANLIIKIKELWASLFEADALFYRYQHNLDHFDYATSLIVQTMIPHDKSGFIFTSDPATHDKAKLVIEVFPPQVKKLQAIPDHYEFKKANLTLNKEWGSHQKINHNQLMDLALLGKKMEQQYYFPQEIEWAIHKNKIHILGTKPLTLPIHTANGEKASTKQLSLLLTGIPGSHGIVSGPLKILLDPKNVSAISQGDIIALHNASPSFLPAIKKAAGLIVDQGGRTSYAANVARQIGIPAIVGSQTATHLSKNSVVTLNGTTGEVYKGAHGHDYHTPKTATGIFISASNVTREAVDHTIKGLILFSKHTLPKEGATTYVKTLTEELTHAGKLLQNRPVLYKLSDPSLHDTEIHRLELEAIKQVKDKKQIHNIGIILTHIRSGSDMQKTKYLLMSAGIHRSTTFNIWINIATPASALALEEFIKLGIDGVMIDLHSLTAYMLGMDPRHHSAHEFDQLNPAVLMALEKAIKTAKLHHIPISVQFQTEMIHPSLLEKLVQWGVASVSVEPHMVDTVRQNLMTFERRLLEKHHAQ